MKKLSFPKICMTVCLSLGLGFFAFSPVTVRAAEVIATVQGKVLSGTTADLLLLNTDQGNMEIRMDSETDTSSCKVLLPEKEIKVSVAHGNDGYLHAVTIKKVGSNGSSFVNTTGAPTVSGKLSDKSKGDILVLETNQGDMELKLDSSTDMSDCSVLVVGGNYNIVCSRGSDAYMHALYITDKSLNGSSNSTLDKGDVDTITLSGYSGESTQQNLLYFCTSSGVLQLRIDSYTDASQGRVLTPYRNLDVTFYHGDDGYLHALKIKGEDKPAPTASVDNSSAVTVHGKVDYSSSEKMLYLITDSGTMDLKLDMVSSYNNCRVLTNGQKISASVVYGSDGYWHALSISGN